MYDYVTCSKFTTQASGTFVFFSWEFVSTWMFWEFGYDKIYNWQTKKLGIKIFTRTNEK